MTTENDNTATAALCAVLGDPIAHSLSPQLHAFFAHQQGIPLVYEKRQVAASDFEATVPRFFYEEKGVGLNVTTPHKWRAYELCEGRVSTEAQHAGSVNTLYLKHGDICGHNTDGIGLGMDLARLGFGFEGKALQTNVSSGLAQALKPLKHVVILGTGGAASGILAHFMQYPVHITVLGRTPGKAATLIESVKARFQSRYPATLDAIDGLENTPSADALFNATRSQLEASHLPLPNAVFQKAQLAYDLGYRPDQDTAFVAQAKAAGCPCAEDGLGMLIGQGWHSFQTWFENLPTLSTDTLIQEAILFLRNSS